MSEPETVESGRLGRLGARAMLEEAAAEATIEAHPRVVDYGAAEGGFDAASMIAVRSAWTGRGAESVQVVLTGEPSSAFGRFAPAAAALCTGSGGYVSMVPRGLGAALVPPESVSLGFGVTGLERPSKPPGGLAGHVQANASGDPVVLGAWSRAARSDWRRFLMRRAMELRPGGRLVLAVPGRDARGRVLGDDGRIHPALDQLRVQWRQLQQEGRVSAEAFARAALPVYFRAAEELERPFEEGGEGLALGLHRVASETVVEPCPHRAQLAKDHDPERFARAMAEELRGLAAPSFAAALDDRDDAGSVLDILFSRLEQLFRRDPERHGLPRVFVRLHLAKEAARPD